MKKTIIAIGFTVDRQNNYVTGLAMMHELFISLVKSDGYDVLSISLNSKKKSLTKVGKISSRRVIEYFSIMYKVLKLFLTHRKAIFYFNPSTAKSGFYRDCILIMFAKLCRIRIIMQQFGALFESFFNSLNPIEQNMLKWAYNKADLIIVEGEYAKKQYGFIKIPDRIKVIQNGLPEQHNIEERNNKTYDTKNSFKLFFMNNMIESKGYVDVLKALDILINEMRLNVECIFAGRFMSVIDDVYFGNADEAKNYFNNFIEKYNLNTKVKYLNCVFGEEKATIFHQANVFLLPSYYIFEGQPTAILEALSYGCVPIVTKYRLIPDMVDDQCGIFVAPKNPRCIAEAVKLLINDRQLYQQKSKNCIDRFNRNFTKEIYKTKILDALSQFN